MGINFAALALTNAKNIATQILTGEVGHIPAFLYDSVQPLIEKIEAAHNARPSPALDGALADARRLHDLISGLRGTNENPAAFFHGSTSGNAISNMPPAAREALVYMAVNPIIEKIEAAIASEHIPA